MLINFHNTSDHWLDVHTRWVHNKTYQHGFLLTKLNLDCSIQPNIDNTTARPIVLSLDISLDSGHVSRDLSLDLSRNLLRNRSP